MNTPAHIVLGLTLLTRGEGRRHAGWIVLGSSLPDLPMLLFYLWQRAVAKIPERVIWGESYFQPHWQDFFDVFNSLPLASAALALCWWKGFRSGVFASAAVLLHQLTDLPFHREDAHRHFLPFSEWRFASPVSYWDPQYFGAWVALAEVLLLLIGCAVVWRRFPTARSRWVLASVTALSMLAWIFAYGTHVLA